MNSLRLKPAALRTPAAVPTRLATARQRRVSVAGSPSPLAASGFDHRRASPAPRAAADPAMLSQPADAEFVIYRLEEAGSTLLALPGTGYSTKLRTSALEIVRSALESYGLPEQRIRPPIPSAARITRMDESLGWIALIPDARYVLRRIVGARSLVSPVTERHLFTWRRLGVVLGADHKAVQRWHAEAIDLIVAALNR